MAFSSHFTEDATLESIVLMGMDTLHVAGSSKVGVDAGVWGK